MAQNNVYVISGKPGCGSTTTGRLLAQKLDLHFFSTGHYFKSLGKGKETENAVNLWKSEVGKKVQFKKTGEHNVLEKMQIALAKNGSIVIESKLGIHFLGKFADATIWLTAPPATRARRCAKRDRISYAKALRLLREKERLERDNFNEIYGFDFFEQEQEADIVIDTANKTPAAIVDEILKALKDKYKTKV